MSSSRMGRFIVVIPAGVQTFYVGSFMSFQDSGATLVNLKARSV